MATTAHCAYCFEVLSAKLENRKAPTLATVEKQWNEYSSTYSQKYAILPTSSPASFSSAPSATSTSSLDTNASSVTSQSSASSRNPLSAVSQRLRGIQETKFPLFVTWDTRTKSGDKNLRGCIGTFEPQELGFGLQSFALTSAFDDTRFNPISTRELPLLECSITLLTNFEPASDPLDWEVGTHGIRISFSSSGKRYGATYLPDVAFEQGWTKDETLDSLIRKAGYRKGNWKSVEALQVIRYQGSKQHLSYKEWILWKEWLAEMGRSGGE